MAIWQLNFQLVPIGGDDFQKDILLSDKSFATLTAELPANTTWCTEDRLFGCIDSTCVEICLIDSQVDEVSVRLDISKLSLNQITSIIDFATVNDLHILYKSKIMRASFDNIFNMICESDALHYLRNPEQFFKRLSSEQEKYN